MTTDASARIRLQPADHRVIVEAEGGQRIADTDDALRLDETGYPPRYYLPRASIACDLRDSATRTHCPFKGNARYYDVRPATGDDWLIDAAWIYPEPLASVAAIAGHLAFDHPRLAVRFD